MQIVPEIAKKVLVAMFRPIARLCLRNAIGIQEAIELLKQTFVEAAHQEVVAGGDKSNVSRISVITGLHRRDVLRITANQSPPEPAINLVSRITSQWENSAQFQTKNGKPKVLSCEGAQSEFSELVRSVSSDVHHGTILFQLERLKLVERGAHGLKFVSAAYQVREDIEKGYQLLAQDLEDLTLAVEENLSNREGFPQLHARTDYDNVFIDELPVIKEWLLKEGALLHQRARAFVSQFDQDLNPHIRKPAGARVCLGTFGRVVEGVGRKT